MSSIDEKIKELLESSKGVHASDTRSRDFDDYFISEEFEQLSDVEKLSTIAEQYQDEFDQYLETLSIEQLKEFVDSDEFQDASKFVQEAVEQKLESCDSDSDKITFTPSIKKKASKIAKSIQNQQLQAEDIDMTSDVAALIEGEELSEEFKEKAAAIFEAAVISRVKSEFTRLQEEFDQRLVEQVEDAKESIVEKLDEYLDYVIDQWIQENQIAIESGLKNEILESFISGMKTLFESHYIEVPEEKRDVFAELAEQVETTETRMNDLFESNIELRKQLTEMRKTLLIKTASEGLTDTDAERLFELAEDVSYTSDEAFTKKLNHIKESYFSKTSQSKPPVITSKTVSPVSDTPVTLTEDIDGPMSHYLRALTRSTKVVED